MIFYNKAIFKRCFCYRAKYWYLNIKSIPLYFKQIHHLIKYGYDEYATWETFDWFTTTMRSILSEYRSSHWGYACLGDNYLLDDGAETDEEKWEHIIDRMLELLDIMDVTNPKYDSDEYYDDYEKQDNEMYAAKDEFFKLFSHYFYYLWD